MPPNYGKNAGGTHNETITTSRIHSSSLYQSCDAHPRVFLRVRACRFIGSRSLPRFIVLPPVVALYSYWVKVTQHGRNMGITYLE